MSALDIQHGGVHYKDLPIQPVQFWKANMLPGDEACVVKYVTRWREKGGVEDLRKAQHFIQFIQEDAEYQAMHARVRAACLHGAWWRDKITADDYIRANGLGVHEGGVVRHITAWSHTGARAELEAAARWMQELIDSAEAQAELLGEGVE